MLLKKSPVSLNNFQLGCTEETDKNDLPRAAVGQPRCVWPGCLRQFFWLWGVNDLEKSRLCPSTIPKALLEQGWRRERDECHLLRSDSSQLSFFSLLSLLILTSATPAHLWLLCCAPGLRLHQRVWGSFHLHEGKKDKDLLFFSFQNFMKPLKTQTEILKRS